jgi:hypothetical protein
LVKVGGLSEASESRTNKRAHSLRCQNCYFQTSLGGERQSKGRTKLSGIICSLLYIEYLQWGALMTSKRTCLQKLYLAVANLDINCQPGTSVHRVHVNCISHVTLCHLLTHLRCVLSVGTVWRHEKVGRIVIVFRCLREESIYNVGASLYRLAAGRWDER